MRQDVLGDRQIMLDQVALGDFLVRILHALRIGHAHAGDLVRAVIRRSVRLTTLRVGFCFALSCLCLCPPHRFRFGHLDLLDDLPCRLVAAQSLERALPHDAVMRPAAEFDFRHQFRLDEFRAPADVRRHVVDRRRFARQRPELLAQLFQAIVGIAGADAAGVTQFPVLAHGQEDRGERPARLVGRPPADDDEFLLHPAFAFQPGFPAAGAIGRVGKLRDHALELELARMGKHLVARALHMIGIKQRPAFRQIFRASAFSFSLRSSSGRLRKFSPSSDRQSNR